MTVEYSNIRHLKLLLADTDYIACKLAEAETDEERQVIREQYADVITQRKIWRAMINELQNTSNMNN